MGNEELERNSISFLKVWKDVKFLLRNFTHARYNFAKKLNIL